MGTEAILVPYDRTRDIRLVDNTVVSKPLHPRCYLRFERHNAIKSTLDVCFIKSTLD